MKKLAFGIFAFTLFGCAELQQIATKYPGLGTVNNMEIASGLKEALNNGITKEVTKLTATDGFYKNQAVIRQQCTYRILLLNLCTESLIL